MATAPITQILLQNHPVDVLRLELAHPDVQGNKYFKLKYNLNYVQEQGFRSILTFGGLFSNHIHAVAQACSELGIKSIAVLRGEDDPESPTLKFIRSKGMETLFISREMYRLRNMPAFIAELSEQFGKVYVLPEGGTNELAVQGCMEILTGIEDAYDHIFCAVGTGGTLAGIISTPGLTAKVTGVAALKGGQDTISPVIKKLLQGNTEQVQWSLVFDQHFGGYGKYHPALHAYLDTFEQEHGIKPDPMYTGKMFYKVQDMISNGMFASNEKILCIHTGGLQGWNGWHYRYSNKYQSSEETP